MKILALDSSLGGCSVAVWTDDGRPGTAGSLLATESAAAADQAERLAPMIARVVGAAGGDFGAFDRLAVTTGPGHFTGLRAGLAAARGLALATGLELVGVTTLAAVAAGVDPAERSGRTIVVALDSKRAEGFFQVFAADLSPLTEPESMMPAAYAARLVAGARSPIVVVGNGTALLAPALDAVGLDWRGAAAPQRPEAAIVARLAAGLAATGGVPSPLYLHPPATTAPRGRFAAAGP